LTSKNSENDEHSDPSAQGNEQPEEKVSDQDIPVDLYRRLFFDESGMPNISKAVQAASFSCYGLSGNPFSLRVCHASFPISLPDAQIRRVTFSYATPTADQRRSKVEVSSLPAQSACVGWEPHPLSYELLLYGLEAEEATFASPQEIQDKVVISDTPFSLRMRLWEQPHQLAQFYLERGETTLFGRTFALSLYEIAYLLKHLAKLNDRAQLLEQYQAEWQQSLKEWWQQSSKQ
jgi:hypothetical protein